MAPISDAYHISLGGKGYILVDGSYIRKSQQPFSPRFATGSYSYGDLSFWQFLAEESWSGGEGQRIFTDTTKYKRSSGWSFLSGAPRICGGSAAPSGITGIGATSMIGVSDGPAYIPHQLLLSLGEANSAGFKYAVVLTAPPSSLEPNGSATIIRAATSSLATIIYCQGYCAANFPRDGLINPAMAISWRNAADDYRVTYMSSTRSTLATDNNSTFRADCMAPINATQFFQAGRVRTGGVNPPLHLYLNRITFTTATWTAASSAGHWIHWLPYQLSPHVAHDADATLYIAGIADDAETASDFGWSAIAMFTSTALTATQMYISERVAYPDFYIQGLVDINSVVFIIGAQKINSGNHPRWRAAVMQFPNTLVWASDTFDDTLINILPRGIFQVNRAEALFSFGHLNSGLNTKIMRITPGPSVQEVFTLPQRRTGYDTIYTAIGRCGRTLYLYDANRNEWHTATSSPTDPRLRTTTHTLETSEMGNNTPLIQKSLYKVLVELDDIDSFPLPVGETLTIYANNIEVGTMTSDDSYRKEIIVPTEITASGFTIKMEIINSQWRGSLKRIAIQYIPTQLKKRAWGMAIRVEHNQKLLNDQYDRRLVPEMYTDLEAAWKSNVPIDFIDTNGETYKVIITEFSSRQPIITTKTKHREYILSLELLEV